jgi:hypothetical protein
VGSHHHAASTLMTAFTDFLQQDLSQARSPPHVAVCGRASDRWLYTGKQLHRAASSPLHQVGWAGSANLMSRPVQTATYLTALRICTSALTPCSLGSAAPGGHSAR